MQHSMSHLHAPLAGAYWVVPGRLLAGAYPGAKDLADSRFNIENLLEAGIRCIVNLMEPDEEDRSGFSFVPYDRIFQAVSSRFGIKVRLIRYPFRDLGVPSRHKMVEILDTIDEAIEKAEGVYVHCRGGIGRTGTVVGCYLIRHGLATGANVLEQIALLRREVSMTYGNSPETFAQRLMVKSWPKRR
jgi:hypothetical protein